MEVTVIIGWLALCFVAAFIAWSKGRSGPAFFFLSLFLSPLVGLIVAACIAPNPAKQGKKKCSRCAEFVQPQAKVCRFCQHDFAEEEEEAARSRAATARVKAEQAAEELKKPWLQRNLFEVAYGAMSCLVVLIFIGVMLFHNSPTPVSPDAATSSDASKTQVEDKEGFAADEASTKVAQSAWNRRAAKATKSHCYIEGMTKEQVTTALGKPVRTYSDTHDYWTYFVTEKSVCLKYDGETCLKHPMNDANIRFSINGHAEDGEYSGNYLSLLSCK